MESERLLASKLDDLKPRERILRTALILFNSRGSHRTGTDLIISESGVAKMTFFRLFKSKGHLIAEILTMRDADWFLLLRKHTVDTKKSDHAKVLGLFDAFAEWFERPDFSGCPFIRGLYDFLPEHDDQEIIKVINEHYAKIETLVSELLRPLKLRDQKKIAAQIMTLMAGSIVVAQVTKSSDIAILTRAQVDDLLKKNLKTPIRK